MVMDRRESNYSNSNCISINTYLGHLIDKLMKMLKKVSLDDELSKVLDDFLQKLNECDIYLANGIFNTNFAEAALLLQNSAELYSKKVDMLWDVIIDYQKRVALYDDKDKHEQERELENLEERKRKYKRKRKGNEENVNKEIVSNFSFNATEPCDYLNQEYEPNDLLSAWNNFDQEEQINDNCNPFYINKTALFLPQDTLHNLDDNEYIGRYDQFHFASIIDEIFSLNDNNNCDDVNSCIPKIDKEIRIQQQEEENDKQLDNSAIYYSDDLDRDNSGLDEEHCTEDCSLSRIYNDPEHSYSMIIESGETSSNGLPEYEHCYSKTSGIEECSGRISVADSMFDLCELTLNDNVVEDYPYVENEEIVSEQAKMIDKRNLSVRDSAFYDEDDMDEILDQSEDGINGEFNGLCAGVSSVITLPNKTIVTTTDLKRQRDKDPKEIPPTPIKKRRIPQKLILRLMAGVTTSFKKFEKFYFNHYRNASGEGEAEPPDFSDESDEDDEDAFDNQPALETILPELTPEPLSVLSKEKSTSAFNDRTENTTELHFQSINSAELSLDELKAQEQSRQNVKNWRAFILPKLKNIQERSSFNIHDYGSKIMESANVGETRSFRQIVEGQGPVEVARHFLATLQLANTRNIDITGAIPGQLSNNSFQITVRDKSRYHEFLDDYQAPSEEMFSQRLEQVKAMNPNVAFHSTPYGPSPPKKLKIKKVSKRIPFEKL